jgi:plastocyanin
MGGSSNGGGTITVGGMERPSMGGGNRAAGGGDVTIVDFSFQPFLVTVPAGSTVTWHNNGSTQHTVTANDGSFDSGPIGPGGSFSQTFSTPGAYRYHCSIHPNMTGTVMVTGS